MYTTKLKQILTGSSVSPGGWIREHTRIKEIMNVTDPVISGLKGCQRKKSNEWVTEGRTGAGGGGEWEEIDKWNSSLPTQFDCSFLGTKNPHKHSMLARLLLSAESQSTNTFGLSVVRAFWDALGIFTLSNASLAASPRSSFPLLLVKSVVTKNWAPSNKACSFSPPHFF